MFIVEETLAATAASIPRSREIVERVCAAAAASEEVLFALKLAVDEAVSNVVEHAYSGRDDGSFTIRVETDDARFRIVVSDNGSRFDPTNAPAPDVSSDWRERTVGGLGLHLARQVVDEMSYSSDETGNHLVLIKTRKSRPEGAAVGEHRDGREGRDEG